MKTEPPIRTKQIPRRTGWHELASGGGRIWLEVKHYRLMCFGRPLAPWRATRAEAMADAVEQRCGSRDRHSGIYYLNVPHWIREVEANDVTDRLVLIRPTRQLIEVARDELKRRERRR